MSTGVISTRETGTTRILLTALQREGGCSVALQLPTVRFELIQTFHFDQSGFVTLPLDVLQR
jgi:hypothetical protein